MFLFLFIGCFRGFISGQAKYQATEYVVDNPRIVALKTNSIEMVGGEAVLFDALLLSPQETEISDWRISVCGLGNETETFIWDFACFEDQEAVSLLGSSDSLPLSIALPKLPEIKNCEREEGVEEVFEEEDLEEDFYDCSHYLPIHFEATASETPVYAAGFLDWYPLHESERAEVLYDIPMGILGPSTAKAGETIDLSFYMIPKPGSYNMEYSNYHWYIDGGELLDTGLTATTEFEEPSFDYPQGKIASQNQLIIPEDYQGTLRIWVVVHQSWSRGLDMNWTQWSIEVE